MWEQPFNNSAFITGYRVRYQQPAFLDANNGVKVVNVTAKMADINGLHPGVTYNFTVVAFNEIVDGIPSDIASVTTLEEGTLLNSSSFSMELLISNQVWYYCIANFFYCTVLSEVSRNVTATQHLTVSVLY